MSRIAGSIYAALAAVVALFQFALAAGQPWGHLTMGGQFPGVLPASMRLAAVAQGLLLVAMGLVVLSRAGMMQRSSPAWLFWIVVALTALTTALNLVTPSAPERMLWGPVTGLMLVCTLVVGFGAQARRPES